MKLWIARLSINLLYVYTEKPEKQTTKTGDSVFTLKGVILELPEEWFPEVTFENSPQKVEIKLINDECDK